MACDLGVTASVWVGAYALRFSLLPSPGGVPDFDLVLKALPLVLLVGALAYQMAGLYEIHRLQQLPREIGVICKATGLLFLLAITVAFYRRDLYESRLALAMFPVLNVVMLVLSRRLIWHGVKWARGKGLNHGRAVIVGAGRTGRLVAQTICDNRWTGLETIGFVDDARHVPKGFEVGPHLGPIEQLEKIVTDHDIDHVFIALSLDRYGELNQVSRALERVLVEVQLVPDIPNLAGMRLSMREVDNLGFLSLRENPHAGWARFAKRATDLVVGSAALIVLSPLMLGLAIAVKLTSRGPVFYRQTRNGLGRKPFPMLKFRTMRHDAETLSGPVWAIRDDQRCTPLGHFMRRWSLDELPQLFNVLTGQMSLVGPRPERGVFVEKFCTQIPGYDQRHRVKAGITGWAQIQGWRGNTSLRHRVQCDLYYITNWSLGLDLKILAMTLWCGFHHRNAY